MAFRVLTVVARILGVLLLCIKATRVSVDRDNFVMVHLNATHLCQIELHHLLDVNIKVEQSTQEHLDPQLPVKLLFAALVPSNKLVGAPRLDELFIVESGNGQ